MNFMSPKSGKKVDESGDSRKSGVSRLKPGLTDYLAGESKDIPSNLSPYLPHELIGGSIPHLPGTEEEAVWNAASQACGTEKVHFVFTVDSGRVWYLACPSAALSSSPDSWCPLAAALPGNSEFWDRETVYLYEQEGLASALRWDPDTGRMQVFLGAARTLLPRIQSMDANFVTLNPDMADIAPWRNKMLKTEKLSRASARILLLVGIVMNLIIFAILAGQYFYTNTLKRDLAKVKRDTDRAAINLTLQASQAMQSDSIKHLVRIQSLLDELRALEGTLVRYEVNGGRVEWEALIDAAFSSNSVGGTRITVMNKEKDGRVRIRGTQ